jgi:hypothetical protein
MNWYYTESTREVGPLSSRAIKELRNAGLLNDETWVRSEDSHEWRSLGEAFAQLAFVPIEASASDPLGPSVNDSSRPPPGPRGIKREIPLGTDSCAGTTTANDQNKQQSKISGKKVRKSKERFMATCIAAMLIILSAVTIYYLIHRNDGSRGMPNRFKGIDSDELNYSQQEDPMKDLSWYCEQGDLEKVQEKATKFNINTTGKFGYPLNAAVGRGHLKVVKYLITLGANVNKADGWGRFPIHDAANSGDISTFQYIVSCGGKIDQRSGIPYEDVEHMEGCRIFNITPTHDYQPIHSAARSNQFEMVKHLISIGASPIAKDNQGGTPLSYAKNGGEKSESYQKLIKFLENHE